MTDRPDGTVATKRATWAAAVAAGCAGAGEMPLEGGGLIDVQGEPAIVAQPQMDTTLPQVTHMLGHSTATVPYIYFSPYSLCEH